MTRMAVLALMAAAIAGCKAADEGVSGEQEDAAEGDESDGGAPAPDGAAPGSQCLVAAADPLPPRPAICATAHCDPGRDACQAFTTTVAQLAAGCGAACGEFIVAVTDGCVSELRVVGIETVTGTTPDAATSCLREVLSRRWDCASASAWWHVYVSCTIP